MTANRSAPSGRRPWRRSLQHRFSLAHGLFGVLYLLLLCSLGWMISAATGLSWPFWLMTAVGILALVLAVAWGALIGRRLVHSLRELERAALSMAAGNLSRRVSLSSSDEVGAVAQAFNQMADQIQRTIAQQQFMITNASQELRTPLANIKLRSEALLNGIDDTAIIQRFLVEIDHESERLVRLANTLLDLARLDEAQDLAPSITTNPLVALRQSVDRMEGRARDASLCLAAEWPPHLPRIWIWTEQLETILINLLDNAIKYTPAGGTVTLSADVAEDRLRIQVQDTGQGIPQGDLPHIYEPFYRVDKAHSRRRGQEGVGSGVGLGLAIVKQLVDQHGGQIEVASEVGKGTTVTLWFPVSHHTSDTTQDYTPRPTP